MSWGKVLGLAALGVGAVAAAPFTGGGSILGAATAASSLAGAGTIAGAAGVAGAAAGKVWSDSEEKEKKQLERKIAKAGQEASKAEKIVKENEQRDKVILALSALGISMANADGEISEEERLELDEFVGGISSKVYPSHVIEQIAGFVENPPTFNEALTYLESVSAIEYNEIRSLLISVMEADGVNDPEEIAFIQAFDEKVGVLTHS
ncbi:MAG: TerB family tellurite resistance protein [Pasteurella sp.]|nr:TerB family tellurite resistance protein [Pasteurella sp.]